MATPDEKIAVAETEITNLKASDANQWGRITRLEKALSRLVPVWTTVVLMAMSAMTASALTFAAMILRS
jgi:hypothetical protein